MKKKNKSNNTTQIVFPNTLTQEQISSILADAIVKAKEIQFQRERDEQIETTKALNQAFCIVKAPEKKGLKKCFYNFINDLWFFVAIPYKRFDTSVDNRITLNAVRFILTLFLSIVQFSLYILDICGIMYLLNNFTCINLVCFALLVLLVHLFLFFCHGIKLEISSMKDHSLLFNIAALFVAVCALIVSTITLIHGG